MSLPLERASEGAFHGVRPVPRVEIRLLDGFELRLDGRAMSLPCAAQRVVALLALHDRGMLRTYAAGLLWPESADERASANLRSALWYEDWLVFERERFRQLQLHALEALSRLLAASGRFAEAVESGLAAVAAEPLRESAHRCLINAYLAEGNAGEAIRQFVRYRDLLRAELDLAPSEQMELLFDGSTAGLGAAGSR